MSEELECSLPLRETFMPLAAFKRSYLACCAAICESKVSNWLFRGRILFCQYSRSWPAVSR